MSPPAGSHVQRAMGEGVVGHALGDQNISQEFQAWNRQGSESGIGLGVDSDLSCPSGGRLSMSVHIGSEPRPATPNWNQEQ